VLSYPSGMTVSSRALGMLADALRRHRSERATRWRKLSPGHQALLVVAYLRKGETYADLACGFQVGTSTVYRYIREALALLAAMAPTLDQAIEVASRKAFVILDGTLLRIDRVGMASGRDRAFYSGKHKCHGLNVQVIADPSGGLVWASAALPGAVHDLSAARTHGLDLVNMGYAGSARGEIPSAEQVAELTEAPCGVGDGLGGVIGPAHQDLLGSEDDLYRMLETLDVEDFILFEERQ
jgi:hypothetical protein